MNTTHIRPLIGSTCLVLGIALIPNLLQSMSILVLESPWGFVVMWAALAVAYTVWQWKLTEVMIDLFRDGRNAALRLISRLRR